MKIAYFDPVSPKYFDNSFVETISEVKMPQTEVHLINLNFEEFQHIEDLEYSFTNAFVLTETLNAVHLAEKEGFDAFIIGCFLDPGILSAREISKDMFVLGACQSSVELAANLTSSFSILLNDKKIEEEVMRNISHYGFKERLSSFRYLGIDIDQLTNNVELTTNRLKEEANNAIHQNHAEAIIVGCTVGNLYLKMLQREFSIPIIDPMISSMLNAENLIRSKQTMHLKYPRLGALKAPAEKLVNSLLRKDYTFKNRTIIQ